MTDLKNIRPLRFWSYIPEILVLASVRDHGSMRFSDGDIGKANRRKFVKEFLPNGSKLVMAKIAHGDEIAIANWRSPEIVENADALLTVNRNIYVAVTYADCFPLILYGPAMRIVMICHIGYRGLIQKLPVIAVKKMMTYGSSRKDTRALIGPGICRNCYEFDHEDLFVRRGYSDYICRNGNKYHVDIKGIIEYQLIAEAGLGQNNVSSSNICTFERQDLFSARREKFPFGNIQAGMMLVGMPDAYQKELIFERNLNLKFDLKIAPSHA